ncbi:heat-inducible transcription repressor HrcA [Holospora obtusa F1]|uniref:Heat-inducible transcription repressor HrcA n=1 Tax=Holospora obtusa F1 TaxID=1399147 RepID=W6TH07_HOLOB|nr:hypothetical protein [Holospora obtusa]ETZ07225.1 heat-inducible transcription repressor HrcA [Holospora obtusa F1]
MTAFKQKDFEILWHVIDIYLEIRSPVSSKRVAERMGFTKSSATLRAVMSKLEKEGFLSSEHCSSGRIPTSDALRLYVQRLSKTSCLSKSTEDALQVVFESWEAQFCPDRVIQTIASLCGCAGFVFIRSIPASHLKYLDFVYISPERAMAVLIFENETVSPYALQLPKRVTPEHLYAYHRYLNPHIVTDRSLSAVRRYVLHHESPEYLSECLENLEASVMLKQTSSQYMLIKGQSQLIDGLSGTTTLSTFQSLLQWLEKEDALMHILSQLPVEPEDFYIFFGREHDTFSFEGFNLVFRPFSGKDAQGAIGAIGPFYMDYQKVIPVIEKMTKLMKE